MHSAINQRRAEACKIVAHPNEYSPSLIALAWKFLKQHGVEDT